MPTRDPFEKKSVYHSALVKEGRIEVTICSDGPQKSTYKNQPDYIEFKLDGNTHYYSVENPRCGEALTGYKGQTVEIEATGGRDDADIEVFDGGGRREERRDDRREERREPQREERREERPRQQERSREPAHRDVERPTHTKEERQEEERKAFRKAKLHAARCSVLSQIALKAATHALDEHFGPENKNNISIEDVRALGAVFFIELSRSTDLTKLPAAMPEDKPPQEKPPQEPRPSQQRAPEREERREPEPRREDPPPQRRDDPDADIPEDDIPF